MLSQRLFCPYFSHKLYIVGNKDKKKPAQNRIAGELQSTPANKSAAAAPKTGLSNDHINVRVFYCIVIEISYLCK